ncbi:EscU/YscU/HrcU family type III secretion system export apparatus switch protein [Enterobacter hormaechei]
MRDEYKQMEGDPHVKGRIRQMQRAAPRAPMLELFSQNQLKVTKPTHKTLGP